MPLSVRQVFLGGLPRSATEEDVREFCKQAGTVRSFAAQARAPGRAQCPTPRALRLKPLSLLRPRLVAPAAALLAPCEGPRQPNAGQQRVGPSVPSPPPRFLTVQPRCCCLQVHLHENWESDCAQLGMRSARNHKRILLLQVCLCRLSRQGDGQGCSGEAQRHTGAWASRLQASPGCHIVCEEPPVCWQHPQGVS